MRICDVCGAEFRPKRTTQHLCSISCRGRYLNTVKPPRAVRGAACAKCGRAIETRGLYRTYCQDCREPERSCLHCGTAFRSKKLAKIYCSIRCFALHRTPARIPLGRDHPNWTGGHPQYRGPGWRDISLAIRRRDGWRCRDCGAQRRGRALHVHHLIRAEEWDRAGSANDPENLISLCGSCHSHRHNGYETFDVRAYRRAYYQAHREKAIAYSTAWNREHRAKNTA
jgi:5-methylcytosine-specific restriction endonuclease McrA